MSKPRITPFMLAALRILADGRSLRGNSHASTYFALRRKGLIEDADTLSEAGRTILAEINGSETANQGKKLQPPAKRHAVLLKLAEHERQLDVLNRYAVDEYVEATGAKADLMPYGADKCPMMGRDLSAMARDGLLARHAAGIGDGLCGQGFPRWVWSYRLTAAGKSRLEQLRAEESSHEA